MKKRMTSLLLSVILILALVPMQAEAATKLTQYINVETAKTSTVSTGTIRYINQMPGGTYYYSSYWGNNESVADIQCNLASISMALSYCGVNKLPAQMTPFSSPSTIVSGTGASLNKPTSVSAGVDRMRSGNGKFSPVVIWMGAYHTSYGTYEHWVVVADRISDNTYYVVDPGYGIGQGAYYKVKISGSTLTAWGSNSTISGVYQFYNPSASIKPTLTMKYNVNGGAISSTTYKAGTSGAIQKSGADFTAKWAYDYCPENGLVNATTFGMSRTGYAFKGWSLSKDGSSRIFGQDEKLKAQDIYPNLKNGNATVTLYAIWKPVLSIKYNVNGGSISSATFSVGSGGAIQKEGTVYSAKWEYDYCPENGLVNATTYGMSRAGYDFVGWSLSKDGSTRVFGQDEKIKAQDIYPNLKNGGTTVTLYAIWTPKLANSTSVCAKPEVKISANSNGKPYLTWEKVDGATSYEVYYATSASGEFTKLYTTSNLYLNHNSAVAGKTYYYKVMAVSSKSNYANSAYSNVVSFTCKSSAPAAPVISISNNASTGKPRLSWKAVSGAAQYEVYRATSKTGTYSKLTTTTNLYLNNTSAVAGTTYYYKVRALNANGTAGEYSNIVYITCDCAKPVVSVKLNSSNHPYISWAKVDGATSYEVYYATSAGGEFTKLYTTSNLYLNHNSAKAGTTYYYKVLALSSKSSYATSAYSDVVSIKAK